MKYTDEELKLIKQGVNIALNFIMNKKMLAPLQVVELESEIKRKLNNLI